MFVDGSFWHGHPSKWQPGRWKGYWDEKIKRNIARDERQNAALADAGWEVIRVWDFEVEQDPGTIAGQSPSGCPSSSASVSLSRSYARRRTAWVGANEVTVGVTL